MKKRSGRKPVADTPRASSTSSLIRDRVKEFRRVPARELLLNEKNWRVHGYAQRKAMGEILREIGIAGAFVAYHSERNGGKLTLIDGELRATEEPDVTWPTLILDVNDEEADLLLTVLDPLRGMADTNPKALEQLLQSRKPSGVGLDELLSRLSRSVQASADGEDELVTSQAAATGPPEMELQPFEHFDYVVLLFRNSLDWMNAVDKLGLQRVAFTQRDGKSRKVGLGRVVDGRKFMELLK